MDETDHDGDGFQNVSTLLHLGRALQVLLVARIAMTLMPLFSRGHRVLRWTVQRLC